MDGALSLFVGYLLLDALIGNTDRHHENWGMLSSNDPAVYRSFLAPTFDHASSLGRNEPLEKKRERLITNDRNYSVEGYADRAISAFYDSEGDTLSVFSAFQQAIDRKPEAAMGWLDRLRSLENESFDDLLARLPSERISEVSVAFARRMLEYNRDRLLELSDN